MQVEETVKVTNANAEASSELGRLALSKRRQLRAINCANVKSVIGANMLMIATALEQANDAVDKPSRRPAISAFFIELLHQEYEGFSLN